MNESCKCDWKRIVCEAPHPGDCSNYNTWDGHAHKFATQIGIFKIRMWAWGHLIGPFAQHWTWEITNKYRSINELGSFSQNSPKTKTAEPSSVVRIIHLLSSQKQSCTFSHDKTYIWAVGGCFQAPMTTPQQSPIYEGEVGLSAELSIP